MSKDAEYAEAEVVGRAPRGRWKDTICDCFRLGICHSSLWCAWCCPNILMAQVLTRMKLSWIAHPTSYWQNTFRTVIVILVLYSICVSIVGPPPPKYEESDDDGYRLVTIPPTEEEWPTWKRSVYQPVNVCFGLYTLYVLTKLRGSIRSKYAIPGDACTDCCCVFWCPCCATAQMARQTIEIEHESNTCCTAACCSSTGLNASSSPEYEGLVTATTV